MLTPGQMSSIGVEEGLPFLWHGGMLASFIIGSPLVAAIVAEYGSSWSVGDIFFASVFGVGISIVMHETYKKIPWPEAHVRDGHLTSAGQLLRLYMAIAIAVFLLYYIWAPYTPWMWLVSGSLVVFVAAGTHIILGIVKPTWYAGDPLHDLGTWLPIIGTAVLTFGITAYRAW
jgi:small-conductance mechanosensitive channel